MTASLIPAPLFARIVAFRRDLHRHPELSWAEQRTAERIEAALRALGLSPRRVADTGVIADLPGLADGPCVALRADTDALPVQEATGLPFASENAGVMHACGHDGHSAMLLGAASLLVAEPPPRPVRLLWQPAEEKAAGALAMIAAGAMEGVGRIFGGHIDPRYPTGVLVVTEGAVNASTDNFFIEITGRGGHGARPHEAVDAVVVGGLLITALQTVVSRVVDPAHPAVISVGSFHAGTAPNVIAGRAQLSGTLRAQKAAVREQLRAGVRRAAAGVGQVHGATIEVRIEEGTPPLINTPDATALAWAAAAEVVGPESVVPLRGANMGGEDFARYLDHAPGCYIRFGARPASGAEPAHSGRFDFDEGALACGAAWYDRVARLGGAI